MEFLFIGRLFQLQITTRCKIYDPIKNAAVEAQYDYPERGYVYDRNGTLLIANQLSYDVMVQPNEGCPYRYIRVLSTLLKIDKKASFHKRL